MRKKSQSERLGLWVVKHRGHRLPVVCECETLLLSLAATHTHRANSGCGICWCPSKPGRLNVPCKDKHNSSVSSWKRGLLIMFSQTTDRPCSKAPPPPHPANVEEDKDGQLEKPNRRISSHQPNSMQVMIFLLLGCRTKIILNVQQSFSFGKEMRPLTF